jgi:VanZ family protein
MHRHGGSVPGKGDHVKSSQMLTLGYMGLLLLVSSFPVTPDTESTWNFVVPFSPASQDFLHIPAYCLLALLWAKTLKDNGTETRLSLVAAVVVTSAFGAMTELSQVWVPGRCASLLDWVFDSYGALAATGIFWIGQFFMPFEILGGTCKFKEQWGSRPVVGLAREYRTPEARPLPDVGPANSKYVWPIRVRKRC